MLILYCLALASLAATGSSQGAGSGASLDFPATRTQIPPSLTDVQANPSPYLRDPTAETFTVDVTAYPTMQDCEDGTNANATRQLEVPTAGCMNVQPFRLAADEVCGSGASLSPCGPTSGRRRLDIERRLQSTTPAPTDFNDLNSIGSMYVTCLGNGFIRREMYDDFNCMYGQQAAEHYDTYFSENGVCEQQFDSYGDEAGVVYKFEWQNDCEVSDLMGKGGKRFCPAWTTSPPTTPPTYPPHPFEAPAEPDTFPFTFVFFAGNPDNMQACQDWNLGDPAPYNSFVFEGPSNGCLNTVPSKVGLTVDGQPAGNPFYNPYSGPFSEWLTCLDDGDTLRSDFYSGWDCNKGTGSYVDFSQPPFGAANSYVTTTHNTCRRQLGQDPKILDKDAVHYKMIWTNGGKCTATVKPGNSSPPTKAPTIPQHPYMQDPSSKVFPFEYTYYETMAACQAKDAQKRYDVATFSGDAPADGCANINGANSFYDAYRIQSEYITCQPGEDEIRSDFYEGDWNCGAGKGTYSHTLYTKPDTCYLSQDTITKIGKTAFYRMEWRDGSCKGTRRVTPKPTQGDPTFKPSPSPPPVVNCPDADIGPAVRLAGMAMMVSFAILALLIWKICWLDNKTFNAEGVEMMRLVMRNEVNYAKPNQKGFSMAGKSEDYSTH